MTPQLPSPAFMRKTGRQVWQATRSQLQAAPFVNGTAIVTQAGRVVATLYREPQGIEVKMQDVPVGGGRNLNTALDTVAANLRSDPRSATERLNDDDAADYADTVASIRAGL